MIGNDGVSIGVLTDRAAQVMTIITVNWKACVIALPRDRRREASELV